MKCNRCKCQILAKVQFRGILSDESHRIWGIVGLVTQNPGDIGRRVTESGVLLDESHRIWEIYCWTSHTESGVLSNARSLGVIMQDTESRQLCHSFIYITIVCNLQLKESHDTGMKICSRSAGDQVNNDYFCSNLNDIQMNTIKICK